MKLNINVEIIWIAIGFLGQILFSPRFFFQWLVSEKKKESVIPISFWYFSIGGADSLFLCYSPERPGFYPRAEFGGIYLFKKPVLNIPQEKPES